jgi:release factor glutamine methyltransferase
MTVQDALSAAEQKLAHAQIDTARLDAELLLAHLLDVPQLRLWLKRTDALTTAQADKFDRLLARRAAREPLQHITGWTSFLGLEIHVNRDVLIPRPETEVLAQLAIEYLRRQPPPASALDWGTGSGCLALVLAAGVSRLQVIALDASADALRVARANAIAHRRAEQIQFVRSKGFLTLSDKDSTRGSPLQFDAIVANPPYIASAEIARLAPEVRDHDPRLALDGGVDGLACFRELAAGAKTWLKPTGRMFLEFGDGQARALQALFASHGWEVLAVEKDLSDRERVLIVA